MDNLRIFKKYLHALLASREMLVKPSPKSSNASEFFKEGKTSYHQHHENVGEKISTGATVMTMKYFHWHPYNTGKCSYWLVDDQHLCMLVKTSTNVSCMLVKTLTSIHLMLVIFLPMPSKWFLPTSFPPTSISIC